MDSTGREAKQEVETAGIAVVYQGVSAKAEAESLHDALQASGIGVEPLSEIAPSGARLGVAEIFVTIVVTAAAKAVITTALQCLEDYLRERMEKERPDVRLQVVLKPQEMRFPLSLRRATTQAIIAFFENVRKSVASL